jgi:hypothetical protein
MIRIAIIVLIASAFFSPAYALGVDPWSDPERNVLDLVNQDRADLDIEPLTADSRLHDAAVAHSLDMAGSNVGGDTGSDGGHAGARAEAAGYAPAARGETIAAGYLTAESVVKAWLASPGRRATLLSGIFTDAGVGYVATGANTDFETYWTLVVAAGDMAPEQFPLPARFAAARADPAVAAPAVVPLPSSFWLFLTALATGLSLIRRRVDKTKT